MPAAGRQCSRFDQTRESFHTIHTTQVERHFGFTSTTEQYPAIITNDSPLFAPILDQTAILIIVKLLRTTYMYTRLNGE